MSHFSGEDLVFYKENDKVMSGGYSINSIILKEGLSPITTYNYSGGTKNHESNNSLFENLAVPAGLFYMNPNKTYDCVYDTDHKTLSEDIHDKLFSLIEITKTKKKSRKNSIKSNKKVSKKSI